MTQNFRREAVGASTTGRVKLAGCAWWRQGHHTDTGHEATPKTVHISQGCAGIHSCDKLPGDPCARPGLGTGCLVQRRLLTRVCVSLRRLAFLNTWPLGHGANTQASRWSPTPPRPLTNLWCRGWEGRDPHFHRRWEHFLAEWLQ